MVDKDMIYRYLGNLEESLKRIENMDVTFEMILGNEDIQDLLDRRMQKAIEACLDIAAHLVASEKLGQAKSAKLLIADYFFFSLLI
ncbi:MAG TPA: HepT-like ribonuclease domain-containing protein [Candidatus Bathyarchaeia archaeon]|nr:HepT-like ribonuclease domain-containing protein [Candidatus Bathyarchaeia archaeon]